MSLQTKGTYNSVQGKLNLIQSTDSYLLYIVKNVKVIKNYVKTSVWAVEGTVTRFFL